MTTGEFFSRIEEMLIGRSIGPMKLRLIMQPTVAALFAIRAGLKDAREGRKPYFFWAVFTNAVRRPELLRLVWKDVGKLFTVAFALDIIYELVVYRWIYPGQALLVATVLAIVPYLLLRGPVTRIVRRFIRKCKDPRDKPE